MFFLISIFSGALSALPLIFGNLHFVSWFSMVPLLWVYMTKKPLYRYGLLYGIGYYGILYHWFIELYPFDFMGFDSFTAIIVIIVAWVGMTVLQATEIGLTAPLFRLLKVKKRWAYPIIIAALYTILEWIQTLTWMGVPYFRLALSQTGCLANIQVSSLFGSLFVSFLIVLVNGFLALGFVKMYETVKENKKEKKVSETDVKRKRYSVLNAGATEIKKKKRFVFKTNLYIVAAVLLVITNYTGGLIRILFTADSGEDITVAVIQGNISSATKWNGSVTETLEKYLELSRKAADEEDIDIIVWPETVININLRNYTTFQTDIKNLAIDTGATVFVGTFDRVTDYDENEKRIVNFYNAVEVFYPDGTVGDERYYKRHLVPFGEYLPMADLIRVLIPPLANMNAFSDDLTPGTDSNIITTESGKAGCLICFDSIYENLAIDSVRDGAEFIILSTNDSWYKSSTAVYQHNDHAVLRAVETGRYIARAASTGISSIITPVGEILTSLEPLTEGYAIEKIARRSELTTYDCIGDLFVYICIAACVILFIVRFIILLRNGSVYTWFSGLKQKRQERASRNQKRVSEA